VCVCASSSSFDGFLFSFRVAHFPLYVIFLFSFVDRLASSFVFRSYVFVFCVLRITCTYIYIYIYVIETLIEFTHIKKWQRIKRKSATDQSIATSVRNTWEKVHMIFSPITTTNPIFNSWSVFLPLFYFREHTKEKICKDAKQQTKDQHKSRRIPVAGKEGRAFLPALH
jgi:hypothetical protein